MKKLIILAILFTFTISVTYCAFVFYDEKTGTIQTTELSTVFLDNASFLTKVQSIDSSITTIDKITDLNRADSITEIYINDNNIVSTSESSVPTFLWVDNGIIYYYTIAESIDLNNN